MENIKLLQVLKTLSHPELNEFGKFVRSPFFNESRKLIKLFEVLKQFHPQFNSSKFNRQYVFKELYPDEKYNDHKLRDEFSALFKLAEDYLSYKNFSKKAFEKKLSLMYSLYERKLDKILVQEFRIAEQILESYEGIDDHYLFDKFALSELKNDYTINRRIEQFYISDQIEMCNSLIYYFLYFLFFNLNEMIVLEENYNVKYSSGIHTAFMKSFNADMLFDEIKDNTGDTDILMITLYYSNLALQNCEDEELQLKLEKLLKKHSHKFDRVTSYNLYTNLLGIYENNIWKGNFSYYRKKFEVQKDLISKNLLTDKDSAYVDITIFLNILNDAWGIKEFDWTESFIEQNVDKVAPDLRNDLYNYSKAGIAYFRKEFDKALNLIMKVNFDYFKYKSKNLLCKIYYDMNYDEQLLSFIDSYRHYLNNDKRLPKDIKGQDLRFLIYLHKLVKIRCDYDYKELNILKKNRLEDNCSSKGWLLEKIEELESAVVKSKSAAAEQADVYSSFSLKSNS